MDLLEKTQPLDLRFNSMNKFSKNPELTEKQPVGSLQVPEEESIMPSHESSSDALNSQALPKIISFETLARCGEEIWIENHGQIYRLRRTRQGKLILTK